MATNQHDAILSLPFVREATKAERKQGRHPRIFWDVQPTGNYGEDCDIGKSYAKQALDYMRQHGFPPLLNWAVLGMMEKGGASSGIEVGFLQVFGSIATVSRLEVA